MVHLVETTMKHIVTSALLLIGGAIMSCHYGQIVETFGGFAVVSACGPTETGKSTLLKVGLSLTGGQNHAILRKGYQCLLPRTVRSFLSTYRYR